MAPPWKSKDTASWLIVLPIDDDEGVVDYLEYLNGSNDQPAVDAAPFTYELLEGQQYAFLTVTHHPHAVRTDPDSPPGSELMGWNRMKFTEVSLSIRVGRRYKPVWPSPERQDQVWVQPFVWYDNPTMVFSAREIWGAPAEYMRIDRHEGAEFGKFLHLDTAYVGVEVYCPFSYNELLAALHLTIDAGAPMRPAHLQAVERPLRSLLGQLTGIGAKSRRGAAGPIGEVAFEIDALKEFRSAENMQLAIYRALVSSHLKWDHAPREVRWHDPAKIAVDFMWSAGLNDLLRKFLRLAPPAECDQKVPAVFDEFNPTPPRPACHCGAPFPHSPDRPPPPTQPGKPPQHICWDLYRLPATPKLCFSYKADLTFDEAKAKHVYQLA